MRQFSDIKSIKTCAHLEGKSICSETSENRSNFPENLQENQTEIMRGLVSIIMPVYNTPDKCLVAAVKSVMEQTYTDLELLIVDDGSKNECAKICDRMGENEKVTVFHVKNSGVSAARNYGIDRAKGEYIAFLDSDDTMDYDAIRIMVEEISNSDFVAIGCRHVKSIHDSARPIKGYSLSVDKKECINYLCFMNPPYDHIETNAIWGKLYRKEQIKNLRFDRSMMMAEDFKFNFEYIMQTGKGKYIDFTGYNYLEHVDSISRSYKPEMMKTIDVIEKMIVKYEHDNVYDALISRCVNIAFTILMMVPSQFKDDRKRIERFISLYRNRVMRNKMTKRKVKLACLTSYLGYGLTRTFFEINRR